MNSEEHTVHKVNIALYSVWTMICKGQCLHWRVETNYKRERHLFFRNEKNIFLINHFHK